MLARETPRALAIWAGLSPRVRRAWAAASLSASRGGQGVEVVVRVVVDPGSELRSRRRIELEPGVLER